LYMTENKLYPDYDHGSYRRMYIELKEERKYLPYIIC